MDKDIKLARINADAEVKKAALSSLDKVVDAGKVLLANKTIAMVIAVAGVEAIRGIPVRKSGTQQEPLFPPALVASLNGVIISKEVLSGVSSTDITSILGLLKGLF